MTRSPTAVPSSAARRWVYALLAIGVLLRLALLGRDLPYYAVDENDVVEQTYIFLAGDLRPSFFSYGPLVSYLLAGLCALGWGVMSVVEGWHLSDVIYRAVFEPTPFYAAARLLHASADVAAVALAARLGARHVSGPTGWAILGLGSAPLLSLNTDFTIGNDTFQGLLALAALGFVGKKDRAPNRAVAFAGAAAGLSLAVKPLQGLLVMPALLLAIVIPSAAESRRAGWRSVAASAKLLAVFGASLVGSHAVANPYSVLEFGRFWRENAGWIERTAPSTGSGWHFGWWLDLAGWPLALFAAVAVAAGFTLVRNTAPRALLLYVLTVVGVYLFVGVRPYWYNAVLPAVLVLCGALIAKLSGRSGWRSADVAIVLGSVLAAVPLANSAGEAWRAWSPEPSLERRPDRAAQVWIEERSPPAAAYWSWDATGKGRRAWWQRRPRCTGCGPTTSCTVADPAANGTTCSARPTGDIAIAELRCTGLRTCGATTPIAGRIPWWWSGCTKSRPPWPESRMPATSSRRPRRVSSGVGRVGATCGSSRPSPRSPGPAPRAK